MLMISDGDMTNLRGEDLGCLQDDGVVPTSVPWEGTRHSAEAAAP